MSRFRLVAACPPFPGPAGCVDPEADDGEPIGDSPLQKAPRVRAATAVGSWRTRMKPIVDLSVAARLAPRTLTRRLHEGERQLIVL